METILSDLNKFEKVSIKKGTLNLSINREKDINNYPKRLQKSGSLCTEQYERIKAVRIRPGFLYRLWKAITDFFSPFPIFSATEIPSDKLSKFFVPKLSSIKFNEFTVKDSFAFAEEIPQQADKLFMGSLDVNTLFTNTLLEETIKICTNFLYNNEDVIEGINKSEFKNLLLLATQESHFIFNDVLHKQKDGVAMGSPLGPTIANVFLSFYEFECLEQCPKEFKPDFYRKYVDNIFLLFESAEHLSKFRVYLNTCHPNMSFSF